MGVVVGVVVSVRVLLCGRAVVWWSRLFLWVFSVPAGCLTSSTSSADRHVLQVARAMHRAGPAATGRNRPPPPSRAACWGNGLTGNSPDAPVPARQRSAQRHGSRRSPGSEPSPRRPLALTAAAGRTMTSATAATSIISLVAVADQPRRPWPEQSAYCAWQTPRRGRFAIHDHRRVAVVPLPPCALPAASGRGK